MTKRFSIFYLMFAVLIIETAAFGQEVKIQKLLKRVTDLTNTLSATELASLEQDLARFEDSTSNQLVVAMLPTIGGEAIEDFALRTAEANRPGQKENDNGVLLLIAKDDRKIRIEVGYGLEGVLPDGLAGTIIRREITPHFRTGDYYGGIKAGVDAIMLATRNEYKAEQTKSKARNISPIFAIIFFLVVFAFIMRTARRRAGALAGLPFLLASGLSRSRGSGWSGGGRGFGGFSGGGGSFGGGGASGGW